MNIENYRNFVAIADCGTISAASKKLLIAQPALTKQLKNFEEEYGTELFIRHSRNMELTEAGKILYRKAKGIISLADSARKEIDSWTDGKSGKLSIAITPSHPDELTRDLIFGFHDTHPGVVFDIREDTTPAIIRILNNNMSEVGLIRTPNRLPGNFVSVITLPERMYVIAAKSKNFIDSAAPEVDLEDLADVPISVTRGFLPVISEEFRRRGIEPDLFSIATSRHSTLSWAKSGDAAALLPLTDASKLETVTMACRPVKGEEFTSERAVVYNNDLELSAVASEFLDYCEEYMEKRNAPRETGEE
ncbi:MAG: LysR family transcriptional regulator [Anaerovoracaceae bacterium]|nr:LysR family transcriptional regulator [Anaerovoracaceae bacterium]